MISHKEMPKTSTMSDASNYSFQKTSAIYLGKTDLYRDIELLAVFCPSCLLAA
jgi:hypothetical protein